MKVLRLSRALLQNKNRWNQSVDILRQSGEKTYRMIRETKRDRWFKILGKTVTVCGITFVVYEGGRYMSDPTARRNTYTGYYLSLVIARYVWDNIWRHEFTSKTHQYCGDVFLELCLHQAGVYVKIGQHLSALGHILPSEITSQLKVLQTECTEKSFDDVTTVLREDLGDDLLQDFSDFKKEPEGTASIAQVHRAKLSGRDVAIKVQHLDIAENAEADIKMLTYVVNASTWWFGEKWNFQWLVDEINDLLKVELDFRNEASNATEARLNHGHFPWLVIPKVYQEYTTKRVLVMDYEAGHAIDDKDWYEENNVNASKVVSKISYLFNEMIFVKGFLHSDPHAGNLKIRKVGPIGPVQIILLDHGQYRRLSSIFQNDFCNFLHSCVEFGKSPKKEHKRMLRYAKRLGVTDTDLANQMACMVLGVRWSQITDGGGLTRKGRDKANNWGERKATEEIIDKYLDAALKILNEIPPELGIIMKSNDLIRCLETKLTAGATAESYLNMSYLCIRGMQRVELSNASSHEDMARVYWKYFWPLSYIFWQHSYYYFLGLLVDRIARYRYFLTRFHRRIWYGRGYADQVKRPLS